MAKRKWCDCERLCKGGASLDFAEWILHAPERILIAKRSRLESSGDIQVYAAPDPGPAMVGRARTTEDDVSLGYANTRPLDSLGLSAVQVHSGSSAISIHQTYFAHRAPSAPDVFSSSPHGTMPTASTSFAPLASPSALPPTVLAPSAGNLEKLGDRKARDRKLQRQTDSLAHLTAKAQQLLQDLDAYPMITPPVQQEMHDRFLTTVKGLEEICVGNVREARQATYDILAQVLYRLGPPPPSRVFDACKSFLLHAIL
jgi:hypothetical protein